MMHIFHKWETLSARFGTGTRYMFGMPQGREEIALVIEGCPRCGKLRAYIKDSTGEKYKRDIDFILAQAGMTPKELWKAYDEGRIKGSVIYTEA